ncbi:sensor histidine kinase [Streptomyces sp. YIM 98790]|uniref:sensor histidine kinase n=1 Tax=Streptomyces sp. YIM 98790 TaxID=2689077 RepID=UPI00140DAE03|nr:sensor histidine kinase [Streptomyces sp. YIM 98790]
MAATPTRLRLLYRLLSGDRVLAAVVLFFAADSVLALARRPPDALWMVLVEEALAASGCAALAFRRRRPLTVALYATAVMAVYYPMGELDGGTPIVLYAVSLYNLSARGRLRAAVALAAVTMTGMGLGEAFTRSRGVSNVDDMSFVLLVGWFGGLIAFGHASRVREAYLREARERAAAAERERDLRARQSATEERLRIARELHDVLGHSISLINVQCGAALHRSAKRPGDSAELLAALASVRDISRDALRELRATLGALRQVDEDAPTAPAPGLERVPELAERARAGGLDIRLESSGEARELPPQISLAGYRIIQESLTNITRHSGADRARISIGYTPEELRLLIEDNGRGGGASPQGAGSGITGMAERARALGGELTAGDTGSGFRVTARLPMAPDGDDHRPGGKGEGTT